MPIIKRDEIKIIHEEADRTALVKYSARMSPASVFGPREQRAQLPAAFCRIGKADKLSVLADNPDLFVTDLFIYLNIDIANINTPP